MLGVVCVDKPEGVTSHDVVNQVRRKLGLKRVGHAGTLDPIASGLLVIAVGPATRFLQYLPLEPKEYLTTFRFGETTASYDRECPVLETRPVPADLAAQIEAALPKFRGPIEQIPPMYSAIKKDGKALYHLARQGVEVEREARRIFIEIFEIISISGSDVDLRVVCSGGTYIRSLAHDLGEALGCGAHVQKLRRTRVGRFTASQGKDSAELTPQDVVSLSEALVPVPILPMDDASVERIRHGQSVESPVAVEVKYAALADKSGAVIGMARVEGNRLHPECVIPSEAINCVQAS